ncbi:unnamed protein product, partial [Iphiclides podalirius]
MIKLFNLSRKQYNHLRIVSTINTAYVASKLGSTSTPSKSWNEIPGPRTLPLIGQLYHFLPGGSLYKLEGIKLQKHLFESYGPIVKMKGHFGGPDNVLLFDAESSAEVLRSENVLPKRPGFFSLQYYRKVVKKRMGINNKYTGLITDHGYEWRELRTAINPVMMQPKLIKAYATPIDEIAQEVVERIKSLRNKDNMIERNFNDEVCLWILESSALIALGTRLNSFNPNLPKNSSERKLIENIHNFFKISDKLDFKPSLWRYYPTRTFKQAMRLYEAVENLNAEFIKKAMENYSKQSDSDREKSVLEKLLDIDKKLAVSIASDLLFAGIDTVGNMLIPIFYLLAKNPEKQIKLREDLRSTSDRKLYLKACIKEAMRLLPVGFGNLRETSQEYNLLGYKIPKHTLILFCHQYMSLMECHYPWPQEYIPERWLVDKDDPLYHGNAHPFAFSIFGYGARGCIGM